eukprot:jgi/Psemu1/12019/gm1.12019_g
MTSPWLKECVLEELGSKMRKASLLAPAYRADTTPVAAVTVTATATATATAATATQGASAGKDRARLVRILARGQDEPSPSNNNNNNNNNIHTHNTGITITGNDWWKVRHRGKSPNLSLHTNAWLLVTDGSHSIRAYLAVGALKQIFDQDLQNHNHDDLFGRGCCVLLKDYSLECGRCVVVAAENVNFNAANGIHHSMVIRVQSLEPKPGFNHHASGSGNGNGNTSGTIRPVADDIDVLYGLRFLARIRHLETRAGEGDYNSNSNSNSNTGRDLNGTETHAMAIWRIARDWDVAFGSLGRGLLRTPPGGDAAAAAAAAADNNNNNEFDTSALLKLAEEESSTEEAIREWEAAKRQFGIGVATSTESGSAGADTIVRGDHRATNANANASGLATAPALILQGATTATDAQGERGRDEELDEEHEDEEDPSRLFIQNVLATQEDDDEEDDKEENDDEEDETEDETDLERNKPLWTQNEYQDGEKDENQHSIGEEPLLPETQSLGGKNNDTNDDDDDEAAAIRTPTTTPRRHKRQRAGSSDSGTSSRSTSDENCNALDLDRRILRSPADDRTHTTSSRKRQRRLRFQRQQEQQQQELVQKSRAVWEYVKAQLFDPNRTVIYTNPEEEVQALMGGNENKNNNEAEAETDADADADVFATPRKRSTGGFHRGGASALLGSGNSAGTSLTGATRTYYPLNTASVEYYRKYGLARWLSRNTVHEDQDDDSDTDD